MPRGFSGQFPQKVDEKGRTSVPAPFRRVLEAGDPDWKEGLSVKIHVNYGSHLKNNLRVYSGAGMQAIEDLVYSLPSASRDRINLSRLYLGQTDDVTMDKDGRIVLPQRLREKLGIEKDATLTLMGLGDYFEVWQSDEFDATVEASQRRFLDELPEGEDPLALVAQYHAAQAARSPAT